MHHIGLCLICVLAEGCCKLIDPKGLSLVSRCDCVRCCVGLSLDSCKHLASKGMRFLRNQNCGSLRCCLHLCQLGLEAIFLVVSRDANQALFKLSALLINAQCCASHGTVLSLCKGCNECHVNSAQSPLQNTCWKRVLIRHTLVAGAPSTSAADLEIAAINVYKRLKSTRTPLQTTRQAGKALLDASQLCGVELVRTLLGDMPDAQALEAAAQSMKQQLEESPCEGDTEDPV